MDTQLIIPLIDFLQSLPSEVVSLILYGVCIATMLSLFKLFGAMGLFIYNCVAVLAANIQVLKTAPFSLSAEPIALGTIVFATTYLCSDILTEHYGKKQAKQCVWLCFAAQVFMTLLMVVTVGYPSLEMGSVESLSADQAMSVLFTPSPRLLVASLLAFIISQLNDIWIFQKLSKLTNKRWLGLRSFVSTSVSAMVDTVIFSGLAWVILSPNPVTFSTLIFTYILGTFITRAVISILSAPVMYLSNVCKPGQVYDQSLQF